MKRQHIFYADLALLWLLLHIGPHLSESKSTWLSNITLSSRLLLLAGTALCVLNEGMLFWICISWARSRGGRIVRMTFLSAGWALLTAYFWIVGVSWHLHHSLAVFAGPDHVRAFFLGTGALFEHTPAADLRFGCWLLAGCSAAALALILFLPRLPSPSRSFRVLAAGSIAGILLLGLIPRLMFPPAEARLFQTYADLHSAPTVSLFWNRIVPTSARTYTEIALSLAPRAAASTSRDAEKPTPSGLKNVVLISIEALRFDVLARYGGDPRIMPRLNRLAAEGISFDQAYVQSNESSYSKVSLLTGRYPLTDEVRDTFTLNRAPVTRIYDILKKTGFETGYFNATSDRWQNVSFVTEAPSLDLFFETDGADIAQLRPYLPPGTAQITYNAADYAITNRFLAWLEQVRSSPKPLFSFFYFVSSHFPYQMDQPEAERLFRPSELTPAEQAEVSFLTYPEMFSERMRNNYYNGLHLIDELIDRLLAKLEAEGRLQNTILIVTGDHGELFHEHGRVGHAGRLFQESIHVPLIIWGAGGNKPVCPVNKPAGLIDIAPTILALLDLPASLDFQGVPLLLGARADQPAVNCDRPIFSSVQSLLHEDAIISWPWKLIKDYRDDSLELYNLAADPREITPADESHSNARNKLLRELQYFRESQLTYYNSGQRLAEKFYPPRY